MSCLAVEWVTVRRQGLHRGFSVGFFSQFTLLILYIYYILFVHLRNFLVTTGLNYIMQNQLGLNSRDVQAGESCEGKLGSRVRASWGVV